MDAARTVRHRDGVALALAAGVAAAGLGVDRLAGAVEVFAPARLSVNYGFLLLEAFLLGRLFARVGLPRISGYMVAGILFGPYALGFVDEGWVGPMRLIDDLALTFIALTAGAELELSVLRARARSIAWVCGVGMAVTAGGVALVTLGLHRWNPVVPGGGGRLVVAAVLMGVVAVARSPTSAIAVINECRAKGPFTDTVFGVTVAVDTLVILLFAVAMAVGEALAGASAGVDLWFLGTVSGQLAVSVALGVGIGWTLAWYIHRVEAELTVVLVVLSFLITELARWLSHHVDLWFGLAMHLEPLLMATAAGFVVRNFTDQGERLAEALHGVALPIFVVFFSMAGVALDLGALARNWAVALALVAARMGLLSLSSYWGCRIAGQDRRFSALCGLGFYAQAGVSLGLAQEVARRFPGWGEAVTTLLVAGIAVNQVAGPVALKFALDRMGESGRAPPDGEPR